MTGHGDDDRTDVLWDPASSGPDDDAVVRRLERMLAPLRFDPAHAPLVLGARRQTARGSWRLRWSLAAAAVVLLVAGAGLYRWTWPDGRPWPMTLVSAGESRAAALEVGRELRLDRGGHARVQVARIGELELQGGASLTLRSTASNDHRLVLTAGTARVRVWAPPGTVVIKTPAGDVVDLGCIFRVQVAEAGGATVSVESGWVQLDNVHGEMLVPAGASSGMPRGAAPLVPLFDDAPPAFREGVRDFEQELRAGRADLSFAFVGEARARDVMTLLALARQAPPPQQRLLLEQAARLEPPPSGVSVDAIVAGDDSLLWRWHDALDLPPPKSWWRNWRDAFASR